jgi:hypothetical protein
VSIFRNPRRNVPRRHPYSSIFTLPVLIFGLIDRQLADGQA